MLAQRRKGCTWLDKLVSKSTRHTWSCFLLLSVLYKCSLLSEPGLRRCPFPDQGWQRSTKGFFASKRSTKFEALLEALAIGYGTGDTLLWEMLQLVHLLLILYPTANCTFWYCLFCRNVHSPRTEALHEICHSAHIIHLRRTLGFLKVFIILSDRCFDYVLWAFMGICLKMWTFVFLLFFYNCLLRKICQNLKCVQIYRRII